ncbi:hypothetical protein SISNIDRAFT_550336 [Sistotremastrum niveocremeum HHB9708]|uniref:Uncharacterized protein n=1 Tax=Sistotremastrum niveocremeum HHB9708 TaxID=1314777 RepID=A0A164U0Y2_9AGAM|nr:hypothetical protein SISNIDRAFT_550336 [Sistotremastrum niveocremeum HHB9708]
MNHEDYPEIAIVNIRANRGSIVCVLDRGYSLFTGQADYETAVLDFKFHRDEPVLLILDETWRNKVFWVDIPDDMPVLTHSLSSAHKCWSSRKILVGDKPFLLTSKYTRLTMLSPHRTISPSSHVFDIIAVNPYDTWYDVAVKEQLIENCKNDDHSSCFGISRLTFHLHQTTQVECLHFPDHSHYPILKFVVLGPDILDPGIYFTNSPLDSGKIVITSKFEDGHGHGSSVVQLTIPGYLDLPVRRNERLDNHALYQGDRAPSIFNVLTGKLYVCRPEGLHVFQY